MCILTDLKSTKQYRLPPTLHTRKCFKNNEVSKPLFSQADHWPVIDSIEASDYGCDLKKEWKSISNIKLNVYGYELRDGSLEIGRADLLLYSSTTNKPVILGHAVAQLAERNEQLSTDVRVLAHTLFLNQLMYGFLYTDNDLLFIEVKDTVKISKTVEWANFVNAFGLIKPHIEDNSRESCANEEDEDDLIKNYKAIDAVGEMIEDPDVVPLSSFEKGSVGRLRWWLAHKVNRRQYVLKFEKNNTLKGKVVTDVEKDACFFISDAEKDVRKSASMIQYLNLYNATCCPELLVYAHILQHDFHVVALSPFNRIDLCNLNEAMTASMHQALSELHNFGVMLGEFNLNNFAVNHTNNILITDFSKARLCSRVPDVAKAEEHELLDLLIKQ